MGSIPYTIKYLFISLILWAGMLTTQAQSLPDWAEGRWRVSAPSSAFKGKTVKFTPNTFTLFFNVAGESSDPFQIEPTTCFEPLYESDWEDPVTFYITNQQDFDVLTGISTDTIPVVRVYCVDPKMGAQVYYVKKNQLLLTYLGLTCYLKPKRRWLFFR